MDEETLNKIRELTKTLDAEVPREGAAVQFVMHGQCTDESSIEANQLGFLRMGIEFFKAAFLPIPSETNTNGNAVEPDIGYLVTEGSDISFMWMERKETLAPPKRRHSRLLDRVYLIGCAVATIALAFLLTSGVLYWLEQ